MSGPLSLQQYDGRMICNIKNPAHSMIEFLTKVPNTCACSVGRPEVNLEEDRGVSFTSTSATKEQVHRTPYVFEHIFIVPVVHMIHTDMYIVYIPGTWYVHLKNSFCYIRQLRNFRFQLGDTTVVQTYRCTDSLQWSCVVLTCTIHVTPETTACLGRVPPDVKPLRLLFVLERIPAVPDGIMYQVTRQSYTSPVSYNMWCVIPDHAYIVYISGSQVLHRCSQYLGE